jgi:hypothetical protein
MFNPTTKNNHPLDVIYKHPNKQIFSKKTLHLPFPYQDAEIQRFNRIDIAFDFNRNITDFFSNTDFSHNSSSYFYGDQHLGFLFGKLSSQFQIAVYDKRQEIKKTKKFYLSIPDPIHHVLEIRCTGEYLQNSCYVGIPFDSIVAMFAKKFNQMKFKVKLPKKLETQESLQRPKQNPREFDHFQKAAAKSLVALAARYQNLSPQETEILRYYAKIYPSLFKTKSLMERFLV